MLDYKKYLSLALDQAKIGARSGSVPIGAIITDKEGKIISSGYNTTKIDFDSTAHGEILCIRKAGKRVLTQYNTQPTILFTTLEPCYGCSFFITRTNIKTVVWALSDLLRGGIDDLLKFSKISTELKSIKMVSEPYTDLKKQSSDLMVNYYLAKNDLKNAGAFKIKE